MEAKVPNDFRFSVVTAFAGREFVKYEYRIVPNGFEIEAENHPMLITTSAGDLLVTVEDTVVVVVTDYSGMKINELRQRAKDAGIAEYEVLRKPALRKMLENQ